jgi:serine/threonine-protein kinase
MDPDLEAQQRVGTTLCNKWTLERLIGTGGMAAVYVAAHKIGRREAIKILHNDVARDPELRARFEQEAHAVNRFKHPGVVEIRDIDVADDGSPFLVMELLDGEPLAARARAPGGVPLAELLRLTDELLDVLAAAHARGIIHRDIKPDNLFVVRDGRLKVLDFGIARVRADAGPKLATRMGATLGTAPYMPPEQILGQEIDARADLFAVGATMFRLIARRRIHEAANETETLVRMASEPAPPLSTVVPDVPPHVAAVVDRALQFDRAARYPDALTMQADVRALREGRPPPFALGKMLESATPAPSAMRLPAVVVPQSAVPITHGPLTGEEATAFASGGAVSMGASSFHPSTMEATAAATPMAFQLPEPQAPSMSSAALTPEMATRAYAANVEATPPSAGVLRPPGANTTMRSEVVDGAAPRGYHAPTGALAAFPPAGSVPASHTQPAGAIPLPPGATIPVVIPPRPTLFGGAGPNTLLLILVGVIFSAIGVGLTLFFMLRSSGDGPPAETAPPIDTGSDPEPSWPPRGGGPQKPTKGGGNLGPANPGNPRPPAHQPQPQPQPQQPQTFPNFPAQGQPPAQPPQQPGPGRGKGKGKGH